jgi:hypothetical protein
MKLEYQIVAATLLDFIAGDPHWLPHPVELIGRFALVLEMPLRKIFGTPRLAGVITVLTVLAVTALSTYAVIAGARLIHPPSLHDVSREGPPGPQPECLSRTKGSEHQRSQAEGIFSRGEGYRRPR